VDEWCLAMIPAMTEITVKEIYDLKYLQKNRMAIFTKLMPG
jgi:hypothetical protein